MRRSLARCVEHECIMKRWLLKLGVFLLLGVVVIGGVVLLLAVSQADWGSPCGSKERVGELLGDLRSDTSAGFVDWKDRTLSLENDQIQELLAVLNRATDRGCGELDQSRDWAMKFRLLIAGETVTIQLCRGAGDRDVRFFVLGRELYAANDREWIDQVLDWVDRTR
jgi:hypothetical protein